MKGRWVRLAPMVCGAALALACGGKAGRHSDETEATGPVHDGKGLYELRIESLSDDCSPPLWSGNAGEVVVVVAKGQGAEGPRVVANVPVYDSAPDPNFMAARWDVDLQDTTTIEVPGTLLPGCAAEIKQAFEITPLVADSVQLDVQFEQTTSGPPACSNVAQFCTSRRVLHYRWLRACGDDAAGLSCD